MINVITDITERLFRADPYIKESSAEVVAANCAGTILNRICF